MVVLSTHILFLLGILTIIGFMKNRNINHSDNWKTPPEFYNSLNDEFDFDFDPCPYSEGEPLFDGLEIEWGNRNYKPTIQ